MIDGQVLGLATDSELWMMLNDYQAGAARLWAVPGCRESEGLLREAAGAIQAELRRRGVIGDTVATEGVE